MWITSYQTGDWGLGFQWSIMCANIMVWIAFVPNMIVLLSWLSSGPTGLLFIPLVWDNGFVIPAWIIGALCTLPGIVAIFAKVDKRRNILLNVWVAMLILFVIAISAAGIYWCNYIGENTDIAKQAMEEFEEYAASKLPANPVKKDSAMARAGRRAADIGKAVAYYEIYKVLPYPLKALYFLHWQKGVTAFAFCIVPSLLAIWAVYHAMGNRNYFATNPAVYKNHEISGGPLWNEDEEEPAPHGEEYESDHSFNSSVENSEDVESVKPLTKRRSEHTEDSYVRNESIQYNVYSAPVPAYQPPPAYPPQDVVRVNPAANRVVTGNNYTH